MGLLLQRGRHAEQLFCLKCDDPGATVLLRSSAAIVSSILHSPTGGPVPENYQCEDDGGDENIWDALVARGGHWVNEQYLLVTLTAGRNAGLRAIGVGSNLKKRRRAANLAIIVTAALHAVTARNADADLGVDGVDVAAGVAGLLSDICQGVRADAEK